MSINKAAKLLKHKSTKIVHPKPIKTKSPHKILAAQIVKEISGFSPYELKAIEMLKRDEDKKCKRFLKKRLGNLKSANKKLKVLGIQISKKK